METGHPCCVQLQVKVEGGCVRDGVTPCLIQDWDKLEEVRKGRGRRGKRNVEGGREEKEGGRDGEGEREREGGGMEGEEGG